MKKITFTKYNFTLKKILQENSQADISEFISTTISFVDSVERIIAPKRESNLRENRNERNAAEKTYSIFFLNAID